MRRNAKIAIVGMIVLVMPHAVMAEDIKVAIVNVMLDPVAWQDDIESNGARQTTKDVNAKGGVKGGKLVAVKYGDVCDLKQAVAVANKIVNGGTQCVIGHLCSPPTQPAPDIHEDGGILVISPGATDLEPTQRGYVHIICIAGLGPSQGPTAAKYILEKVKSQRIVITHDKQQYGESLTCPVQGSPKVGKASIVFLDGITVGGKDFSALIACLKEENIDFICYGGYYPEMGQMLCQACSVGLKTQLMGPRSADNTSPSNIASDATEGALVIIPERYNQGPANKVIVDVLKADKKDPAESYVWITYAVVQSSTTAMDRSGSREPLDLAKDLKARRVDTVIGPLKWDEKGGLKGFEFGILQRHADGSSIAARWCLGTSYPTTRAKRVGLRRSPHVQAVPLFFTVDV